MTGSSVRRAALFAVPALYAVLGLFHPQENPEVGDDATLFLALHAVQPLLIGGLVYVIHQLVRGLDTRPARIARALTVPFAIAYAVLDAMLGLSWGYAAQQASTLPAADHAAGQRLIEQLLEPTGPTDVGSRQAHLSAVSDRHPMSKPTSTHTRCDHIISLIDECLAEVEADVRSTWGQRPPSASARRVRPRHLALVR